MHDLLALILIIIVCLLLLEKYVLTEQASNGFLVFLIMVCVRCREIPLYCAM